MARGRAATPGFLQCFPEMLTCTQHNKKGHATSKEAVFRTFSKLKSSIINMEELFLAPNEDFKFQELWKCSQRMHSFSWCLWQNYSAAQNTAHSTWPVYSIPSLPDTILWNATTWTQQTKKKKRKKNTWD